MFLLLILDLKGGKRGKVQRMPPPHKCSPEILTICHPTFVWLINLVVVLVMVIGVCQLSKNHIGTYYCLRELDLDRHRETG